jgi:hypothetical protein
MGSLLHSPYPKVLPLFYHIYCELWICNIFLLTLHCGNEEQCYPRGVAGIALRNAEVPHRQRKQGGDRDQEIVAQRRFPIPVTQPVIAET